MSVGSTIEWTEATQTVVPHLRVSLNGTEISMAKKRRDNADGSEKAGERLTVLDWHGCYDETWRGVIVDKAYTHPAKFAHGLISRIYEHMVQRGWLRVGDVVGDPFGGVALGGIIGAYRGFVWRGVELEAKFVDLANRNIELHRRQLINGNLPLPVIVQGDSRSFAEIVGGLSAVVTSPPFTSVVATEPSADFYHNRGKTGTVRGTCNNYGQTPGQIGVMKAGDLDAVITSPPYSESIKGDHGETETARASRDKRQTAGGSLGQSQRHGGYGVTDGQIGAMKAGELDAVVTSPPFEATEPCQDKTFRINDGRKAAPQGQGGYGNSDGQIGQTTGDTYWQAVRDVYAQCLIALKPGGVMAVVMKDYVKKGERVPLCDDTATLLEHVGFTVIERARAWLVKETKTTGLFGEHVETKQRKSFFRLLAERKGSPRIDWEEVIFVRSPGATRL